MCGIAGFVYDGADREEIIERMNSRLIHRGPDAGGCWMDEHSGVTFGHRRLSIRDLSAYGAQPMKSASGRFVIVYNGEIYNTTELREQVEKASGAGQYRGSSDTEVLLEAFEALGVKTTLDEIKGMFAFALYDRQEKKLTLARDRFGEKPLYYAFFKGSFVFASEIGALKCFPAFTEEINRDVIPEYMLLGYIPAPKTIYKGVYKLPPGCVMELAVPFAEKNAKKGRYYDLRKVAGEAYEHPFKGSFEEAADELERLLKAAVASQLVADVPVGTYLSGGIDSACITALAKAVKGEDTSSFTIGFDDPKYDEAPYAKEIAKHLGTRHSEQYVSEAEMKAVIPKIPCIYGEPYADSSQIPTYLVSRQAREKVTVVLSGDAGDELFGGYATYPKMLKLWDTVKTVPAGLRKTAGKILKARDSKTLYRAGECLLAGNIRELKAAVDHYDPLCYRISGHDMSIRRDKLGGGDLKELMLDDLLIYHPEDILVKVDRAGMAVSLENRIPMLDKDVAEFALSLPPEYLCDKSCGKKLLKEVLYRYVPRELMDRPKKGFSVPLEKWLGEGETAEWADELMSSPQCVKDGILDARACDELRKAFKKNGRSPRLLWNVLMLEQWYRSRRDI
ncbi:MAG: asparagine synthase (glutamine-hydrolyzing) [Lachnospiraceae bacterium]|nr:asparagine synthase (glutamine-hydrolyzing) [Lachnospiraceae bacterium]